MSGSRTRIIDSEGEAARARRRGHDEQVVELVVADSDRRRDAKPLHDRGTVFEWPTTRTLPLAAATCSISDASASAFTTLTVRPSALASGSAVCCVRLNSVVKMATMPASFSAVASDAARAPSRLGEIGIGGHRRLGARRAVRPLGVPHHEDRLLGRRRRGQRQHGERRDEMWEQAWGPHLSLAPRQRSSLQHVVMVVHEPVAVTVPRS